MLVVNGESLTQELEGPEPFFRHTAGKSMSYEGVDRGTPAFTVSTTVVGAEATLLRVRPTQVGTATVTVRARDSHCTLLSADFSFNVEVVAAN
jgi:hypothetical protein